MSADLFVIVVAAVLGALIGSFANVVVFRLPEGRSVVTPRSHCPTCEHTLGPLELIPIVSWLALRGRCASCGTRISVRYPLVEAWMAAGFAVLALRWNPLDAGLTVVPLWILFAVVTILGLIDADTTTLPDVLTLPGTAFAILAAFLYAPSSGLPTPTGALYGALIGAGVLVLINRIGSLVLRRFADTRERLWPVGFDQVNLAAVAGAFGGIWIGLAVGLASLFVNLVARRPLRIPEAWLYAAWVLALLVTASGVGIGLGAALGGSVAAAGAWALIGAVVWWAAEMAGVADSPDGATSPDPAGADATHRADGADDATDLDDEPIAMGFGDAKLAALLGAVLGWPALVVGIFAAVVLGALGGLLGRLFGGDRVIPFGPYLALGGLLALFFGDAMIHAYLALLLG